MSDETRGGARQATCQLHSEEHAVVIDMPGRGQGNVRQLSGEEAQVHDTTCSRTRSYVRPIAAAEACRITQSRGFMPAGGFSPNSSPASTRDRIRVIAAATDSVSPGTATSPAAVPVIMSAASPATTPRTGIRRAIREYSFDGTVHS